MACGNCIKSKKASGIAPIKGASTRGLIFRTTPTTPRSGSVIQTRSSKSTGVTRIINRQSAKNTLVIDGKTMQIKAG